MEISRQWKVSPVPPSNRVCQGEQGGGEGGSVGFSGFPDLVESFWMGDSGTLPHEGAESGAWLRESPRKALFHTKPGSPKMGTPMLAQSCNVPFLWFQEEA